MLPQNTVLRQQSAGVIGDLFGNYPSSAAPGALNSASAANNVFGRVFTWIDQATVRAGGTGAFAGFMCSPKSAVLRGSASSPLDPSLTLPNFSEASLLFMGFIFVSLPAAAAVGDIVVYNTTTGALATITPGNPIPVGFAFAHARVAVFDVTNAGIAVVQVNYVPTTN